MIFNPGIMAAAGGAVNVAYGVYTGDCPLETGGWHQQKIETGFRVGAIILSETIPSEISDNTNKTVVVNDLMNSEYFESDDTGFIVKEYCRYYNKRYNYTGFNYLGSKYYYIAIPASS